VKRVEELREATVWASDPHTQVKHLVYRHYLECWMAKILQIFPEATIVDAFAGPGVYTDGAPGSPVVTARTFLEHSAYRRFNRLHLICLEERPDRAARLRREITSLPTSPQLRITVIEGVFAEQQASLSAMAHAGQRDRPVLWLLDPFNLKSVPFDMVTACMAGERDEVLLTLFTDELHRFCQRAGFDKAMTPYFGGTHWQPAVAVRGAGARKEEFAAAYQNSLAQRRLLSGKFAVRLSNRSARYHLILTTHSEAGLRCWNPVTWKLDRYSGQGASVDTAAQPDLFGEAVVSRLHTALRGFAGTERDWASLISETMRLGHTEKHLRSALNELAGEALAIRTNPIRATTPWPTGCTVRFYAPEDLGTEAADPGLPQ
jgi:three-Cys-motif partner protein